MDLNSQKPPRVVGPFIFAVVVGIGLPLAGAAGFMYLTYIDSGRAGKEIGEYLMWAGSIGVVLCSIYTLGRLRGKIIREAEERIANTQTTNVLEDKQGL